MTTETILQDSQGADLWKIASVGSESDQLQVQLLQEGVWVSCLSLNKVNGGVAVNRHPGTPNQNGLSIGLGKKDGSDAIGGLNYLKMFSNDPYEEYFQINIGQKGDPSPSKRYAFLEAVDQSVRMAPWVFNPQGGGVGIGLSPGGTFPADTLLDLNAGRGTPLVIHALQAGIVQLWAGFKANDYNFYIGTGGTSAAALGQYGVYLPNTGNSWVSISDERLKKDIRPLQYGLAEILALRPVMAKWRAGADDQPEFMTLLAQAVQKIMPEAVHVGAVTADAPDGQLGVDYPSLVMPLIISIHEMDERMRKLESQAV
jgi:hypothetical protein